MSSRAASTTSLTAQCSSCAFRFTGMQCPKCLKPVSVTRCATMKSPPPPPLEQEPYVRGARRPGRAEPTDAEARASSQPRRASRKASCATGMRTVTWNISAVNNNPFEYWMTHPSPEYARLMKGVEDFIVNPGARDVPVGSVFTDGMWKELKAALVQLGCDGVEQTEARWANDLSKRQIIAGFMQDKGLGEKRLISMPDRVTNTIGTSGGRACRPTPTSCCAEPLGSVGEWWPRWRAFMFETPLTLSVPAADGATARQTPAAMLGRIKRAKYPALGEEEEAISVPLQALCLAVRPARFEPAIS